MACIPCYIIPLVLLIFHRFIRPILIKLWNKWNGKQETEKPEEVKDFKTEQKLFCEKYGSCKRETAVTENGDDKVNATDGKVKTS